MGRIQKHILFIADPTDNVNYEFMGHESIINRVKIYKMEGWKTIIILLGAPGPKECVQQPNK